MEQLDLTYFYKTKSQANDFSARLSNITLRLFENDFNLEKALLDEFGIQKKEKLMSLLRNNNINVEKLDILKGFFTKVLDTTAKLPVLEITIAFEPKDKTLQAISEWFVMSIKRQILFDIKLDRNLIAGAKINFNGKYIDATIKPKFDAILEAIQNPVSK